MSTTLAPFEDFEEETSGPVDRSILNEPIVKSFFLATYILVFLSCVFGNFLILLIIISNRSMRTVTNFFLANLAIADLLVGIFCVFQNAAHFVLFEYGAWPFGRIMCHSYVYILHMIPNISAGILVLLSIERFIAVIRPMLVHHLMTKSVLIASTIIVWTASAIMNLPYLIAVQYIELNNPETGEKYGICTRRFLVMGEINVLQVVTTINLIVWYAIPLVILLVIYITVGIVLLRSTDRDSVTRSSQATTSTSSAAVRTKLLNKNSIDSSQNKANLEAVDSRKRVIKLVVVIVSCFALLSLPRYLYLTWSVWRDTNAPRCLNCLSALIQPTTFLLLFINSGINPILYAFLSQRFRKAITDTLSCASTKEKRKKHFLMKLRKTRCSDNSFANPIGLVAAESPRKLKPPLPLLDMTQINNGVINIGYGQNADSPIETKMP
uniref:G-protein coupled receptors family 1 profile domain-containing protein n=1 Tax=Panagrolaimus davidi TaxID=227884 RepID=A0A914QDQ3_9BILA